MRQHDQFNFEFSINKKKLLPKENGKFSRLTWPQEAWKRQQTPNPPAHPPTDQSQSTQIHQEINPNPQRNQPESTKKSTQIRGRSTTFKSNIFAIQFLLPPNLIALKAL